MEIGISAPQWGPSACPAAIHAVAAAAEHVGYASVWTTDHYPWRSVVTEAPDDPPLLDPVAVLAMVAAHSTRARLGVSTLVVPWYRTNLLVRAIATLEVLAEGRVTVALEGGGAAEFLTGQARRTSEAAAQMCADVATPRRRTPILLAGAAPSVLDAAGEHADGWNPVGLGAADVAAGWARVRDAAARSGREPDSLRLVARADVVVHARALGVDRAPYTGSLEQVAGDLVALRRAGADEVVVGVGDGVGPAPGLDTILDVTARLAEAIA
jgi:alkanesulfonate monooxygenase SsuD/methylene tetrahydromethanopterin reductase-like flavin-dependent oxidoreductase (luciferase family)